MAAIPDKVLNWLYSVLTSEYADVNRTYSDAAAALSQYPTLSPRTDVYTYENGASALLLLLSGTVPVNFRGTVYRFPIAVWVPHPYPHEAPLVYVTPAPDMFVRPGQHVGTDGRVYHPYLAQWGRHWDKSTIADFLAVLRSVFAKEPPVMSKQQATYRPPQASPAPPPVPPPPEEWRRSLTQSSRASPVPQPAQQPVAPPKPPKPHEQPANGYSQQPQQAQSSQQPMPDTTGYAPPPLPPKPHAPAVSAQPHDHWQPQRQFSTGSVGVSPPYPQSPQGPVPPELRQTQRYESPVSPVTENGQLPPATSRYNQPTSQPPYATGQPATPISPRYHSIPIPPQVTAPPLSKYPPQPPGTHYAGPAPSVQQQHPKPKPPIPDLLDSPLDVTLPSQTGTAADVPVPPVPPNPQKDALLHGISAALVARTRDTVAANVAAVPALQAQHAALRAAHAQLTGELELLNQLDADLTANEQILARTMREADRVMEEARRQAAPDVDAVLVAPTVVGTQLYQLCAEEMALGDAVFLLGKALDRGRVGAEVFVKQTRVLARERFLKKALIKKIARGLGLEEGDEGGLVGGR